MTDPPLIIKVLLAAMVITAGAFDIRFRRIPNWLTVTGVLLGLALNAFLFEGLPGLRLAAEGLGLALVIYLPLYMVRGMGAGDVKLMAAVGALVGPWNWLGIFVITALVGGVIALVLLLSRGRMRKTFSNVVFLLRELISLRPPYLGKQELDVKNPTAVTLPHGAVITVGSLIFLAAAMLARR